MDAAATHAERVAELARSSGRSVAVAESLTSGRLASALGVAPEAASWFTGGVVAYAPQVKFDVLGVTPGAVATASCAIEMAAGVRDLLGADLAVAVTGVGGPGPDDDGVPAGIVFVATATDAALGCTKLDLPGDPKQVVEGAVTAALTSLVSVLEAVEGADGGTLEHSPVRGEA